MTSLLSLFSILHGTELVRDRKGKKKKESRSEKKVKWWWWWTAAAYAYQRARPNTDLQPVLAAAAAAAVEDSDSTQSGVAARWSCHPCCILDAVDGAVWRRPAAGQRRWPGRPRLVSLLAPLAPRLRSLSP